MNAIQRTQTRYRLYNGDRHSNAALGGLPNEHDLAYVYDLLMTMPHPLTGEPRPLLVFTGTLAAAHAWIARQS